MRTGQRGAVAAALALAIGAALAAPARAQRANYNDVIIGSRAAAMGGAFTAVADDNSAVFHNPAGIAQIQRQGVSLSVNGYAYQRTDIEGVLEARGATASLTLDSIYTFPTISGIVKPLGDGEGWSHSLALSLVVPEYFEYEGVDHLQVPGEPVAVDVFADVKERVYLAGPSYGFRYGNLYLGASLFMQYVTLDLPPDDPGDVGDLGEHRDYDPAVHDPGRSLVVNPSLGAQIGLSDTWSLLLGGFTDFSAVPDEGRQQLDQIDMYGGSLGVRHLGESSDLTVGVSAR